MKRLRAIPIRVRLTAWYVAVLAIVLVAFDLVLYFALERSLEGGLEDSVRARAESVLAQAELRDGVYVLPDYALLMPGDPGEDDPDEDEAEDIGDDPYARTWGLDGRPTSTAGAAPDPVESADSVRLVLERGRERWATVGDGEESLRVLYSALIADGEVVGVLETGEPREDVLETLGSLRRILLIATPLGLLAASVGGVFLAQRALSPIDRITRQARRISSEGLGQRLGLDLPQDEVGRLARTFDEMLARLDVEFQRQRQFTADASHELRTPLTALKGHLDVALSRDRPAAEYRTALAAVNVEVDRMIALVGRLLTLARADAGQLPLNRDRVELTDLLEGAVEQLRPLATAKQVSLELDADEGVAVDGDEALLLQLALNLLDNAVKYTPEGGSVRASVHSVGEEALVEVRDSGIGIAPEHLPHVFERFYRVDPARERASGSTGLGLAISRWIVTAHKGRIDIASEPGRGTAVTVRLPQSQ